MRISEVIHKLELIESQYGDIECFIDQDRLYPFSLMEFNADEYWLIHHEGRKLLKYVQGKPTAVVF